MGDDNQVVSFMFVTELGERAKVSGSNIRKLLRKGVLKGQKHGGIWVIPKEEAERYLESRKGRGRTSLSGRWRNRS